MNGGMVTKPRQYFKHAHAARKVSFGPPSLSVSGFTFN